MASGLGWLVQVGDGWRAMGGQGAWEVSRVRDSPLTARGGKRKRCERQVLLPPFRRSFVFRQNLISSTCSNISSSEKFNDILWENSPLAS